MLYSMIIRNPEIAGKARRATRRRGFTLVELLVVIGIIALLISILLPSLQAARRVSQRTACAAKLHNIMLAAGLFRNEHKDYYPLAGAVPDESPRSLDDTYAQKYAYYGGGQSGNTGYSRILCPITYALETEMEGGAALYAPNGIMSTSSDTMNTRLILDPSGLNRSFLCPAHSSTPLEIQPQYVFLYACYNSNGFVAQPQSYIFNEYVLGYRDDPLAALRGKSSMIHQSASTMFAADGTGGSTLSNHAGFGSWPDPFYTVYVNPSSSPNTPPTSVTLADAFNAPAKMGGGKAGDHENFEPLRHKGKMNIAFCDGHVEARNISSSDLQNVWIAPP